MMNNTKAQDIVYDYDPDWDTIRTVIEDTSRWSIYKSGIFKHKPTNKLYQVSWSQGATEQQDESPFEYDEEVVFTEVEQVQITTIGYNEVLND